MVKIGDRIKPTKEYYNYYKNAELKRGYNKKYILEIIRKLKDDDSLTISGFILSKENREMFIIRDNFNKYFKILQEE